MKWIIIFAIFIIALVTTPSMVFAQGMIGTQSALLSDGHTAREEAEGKEIWEKLQVKEVTCENLSDEDFGALGEYYMGQMTGDSHEAMNTMMERMMGKEGEEQMHVVMGKRLSGCDSNAQIPSNAVGFMPMMGGGNHMMGSGWGNMMGSWDGFGVLGWLSMLVFWILLILGVIALIRYLAKSGSSKENKTPLDILKERYARGEINKKEFEEKKRDLV